LTSKKTFPAILCLVLISTFPLVVVQAQQSSATASGDWSMFRSDAARSGVGTYSSTGSQVLAPTLLWKTNIAWNLTEWEVSWRQRFSYSTLTEWNMTHELFKTRRWTEPAVVGGVVYVGVVSSISWNIKGGAFGIKMIDVYAFNANDGAEIWNYRDESCEQVTPPAVVNGVVYFATGQYTCALNAYDSSLLWKYPAGIVLSCPAVVDGIVYVGSEGLRALNANTGHSIWNYTNQRVFSSPAVANGIVYVGSFDEKIHAVDAYTGEKLWDYHAGDFHSGPAVANGVVYAMTSGASIYALDAISGTKIWNLSIPHPYVGGDEQHFAIMNDILYSYNIGKELYAFNSTDGTKIWNYTFGKLPFTISAPTLVKDTVYVSSDSSLYALNAQNGEMLWNYTMNDRVSSPVVVNSVSYVSSGGQLYAIAVPSPPDVPSPPQEPFPTVPITLVAAVVVIVVSLLIYVKKYKH
jgi:outer membrane protein assembly factor BamB